MKPKAAIELLSAYLQRQREVCEAIGIPFVQKVARRKRADVDVGARSQIVFSEADDEDTVHGVMTSMHDEIVAIFNWDLHCEKKD